jgi:acyl-CoA thioester hydrolase
LHHGEPLKLMDTAVARDWVDYNGHMNDAAYALVFSRSGDALMDRIGLDAAARKASGRTLYTLQIMLHYFKEALEGAPLSVACQLLEHDSKRMRLWLEMRAGAEGDLLAASEQLRRGDRKRSPRWTRSPRPNAAWRFPRKPAAGSRCGGASLAPPGAAALPHRRLGSRPGLDRLNSEEPPPCVRQNAPSTKCAKSP